MVRLAAIEAHTCDMSEPQFIRKDIILFVHTIPAGVLESVRNYEKQVGYPLRVFVIRDSKLQEERSKKLQKKKDSIYDGLLICDMTKPTKIAEVLRPYQDQLLAVTCRSEARMADFARVIPHIPYIKTPTSESLKWATDKVSMRRALHAYSTKITPKFSVVTSPSKAEIKKVIKKLGFPLIIKPAGLAQSLLVSVCYHEEEFEHVLKKIFRKINQVYKERKSSEIPQVLVEEFMEGEMYSIDAYVSTRGKVTCCPLVHVKTGRSIGFDDFFGYMQITPAKLPSQVVENAEDVVKQSVRALGLRSVTAHVELMRMEHGWKIIEVGARVGGYRPELYRLSYGIDHNINDILTRIPKKITMPKKKKGYAVAMKFFAKKEGRLQSLKGARKVQTLESFQRVKVNKKKGDMCRYAKNGGKAVLELIMFNSSRPALLADIRRAEQAISAVTK